MKPLSLLELNSLVHTVLETTLNDAYWVVAELSECRVQSNGHCYVEFVQKDDSSQALVAKARGIIWRNVYTLVAAHFEKATGSRLAAGMKVLVQVSVSFHELYGYSLVVSDIDPTYTLGDMARRRQEIIVQLRADGVLTLNKELTLPRPLLRIAVVSSSTAAGYGDFCDQLRQSGYPFTTHLFAAVMQGNQVEQSIIAALDDIAAQSERWDAVAIIRGGGAVSDLNGFDTYLLAANVAQFPLPVLTGIGHERDDTLIDIVAHQRFKTPTAVATFLVDRQREELETLDALAHRLAETVKSLPAEARLNLEQLSSRLHVAVMQVGTAQRERISRMSARLEMLAEHRLKASADGLKDYTNRLARSVSERFVRERHRLELAERTLKLAGPERILKMGYSITSSKGRIVRRPTDVQAGDHLTTRFAEGTLTSTVCTTTEDEET